MRVLSLFSGVGGFDLALERAGAEIAAQCEIDKYCRDVLARHFSAPIITDVKEASPATVGTGIDLICGGFPCQDLSVAGRRAGLAGERSGLFFEFARCIEVLRPRWVIIENVPGLLSSNGGRDMGAVLGTLAQLGYGYAYRVLDAQYAGVPQRRRRVFIVGCLGDGARAVQVLFEPESLSGNPPARGETGKDVATTLGGGAGSRGWAPDTDRMTFIPSCVTGPHTHALTSEGGDASEDGTGGGTPIVTFNWQSAGDVRLAISAETGNGLSTSQTKAVYYSHDYNQDRVYDPEGATPALTSSDSNRSRNFLVNTAVRRLTPLECERLQGFPDNWTLLGAGGKQISDAQRYRMMGNAVAVPVVEWIAQRLMRLEG